MSIWGKIVGGVAGFAVGGPLGALLGVAAGHAADSWASQATTAPPGPDGQPDQTRTMAFTIGVIILGAKMAKADGVVERAEVDAFKRVFHIPPEEARNVGRIFDLAKRDSGGFEPYARQLAGMFRDRPTVLEDLLGCLFHIAASDGQLHPAEVAYLAGVARIFGISEATFEGIRRIHGGHAAGYEDPLDDPYAVLGVARTASDAEIKLAWRQALRDNHPDTVMAQGLPAEFVDIATAKTAALNAAYDKIQSQRAVPSGP
ncbi:TerB family tellurite resistance protein [Nitrospirillum iridis]|uniref:DnaJ like chaperone protein n=1 Tax=Nitrospirillum iridis TaxID=765888 RepID=A0A7X0EAU5_9PROT|nr:TerB family tellurite resistance protein [Nitrospirillum iridis]MBB6249853.1 DnaJ like chaperone protein [Nitrospirillum iridis]